MHQPLEAMVDRLESGFDSIPSDRKKQLEKLPDYAHENVEAGNTARLNFICTHNSRRSHLAKIWTSLAAHHYGITSIETYSGGTEATSFNPRAVEAFEKAGLIKNNPDGASREAAVYDERLNQIATEMLYTMHKVAAHA